MRCRLHLSLALLVASNLPAVAMAGSTDLKVRPAKEWVHKESRTRMPGEVAGFTLSQAVDFSQTQSDVGVTYRDEATSTVASVYLFRGGISDASVWQDRIGAFVTGRPSRLGTINTSGAIRSSFTPSSGGADSGSVVVYPVAGDPSTATGSAIIIGGQWVIAIRATTRTLSPAVLHERLTALATALPVPKGVSAAPPIYAVAPCSDAAPDHPAARSKGGMTEAVMVTLTNMTIDDHDLGKSAAASGSHGRFCRESSSNADLSVYSLAGNRQGYAIVLGDSGPVISTIGLSAEAIGQLPGMPRYAVVLQTTERSIYFRGFDALPTPTQLLEVVQKEQPIATIGRTPKDNKQISIVPTEDEAKP